MQKYFIVKHRYNKIPQNRLVKFITIINTFCLVEDIISKEREWLAKYDIYPINDYDNYGYWEYDKHFQDKIPSNYYSIISELH